MSRAWSVFVAIAASGFAGCSDTTEPVDDGSPVEVEVPTLSVPLLAASSNRLFALRAIDSTARELDSRSLDGDVKWTTSVPPCPSGLDCLLAVDGSSNVYLNTTDGLMSRSGSNGSLRWTANSIQTPSIAIGTSGRVFAPGRPLTPVQLMHAIDAATGNIVWSSVLPPGFDATGTLLDESRAIVYAVGRGAAVAFDTQTGSIKWITSQNCFAGSDGALAADGTIYVTCDGATSSTLYAYTPAGALAWHASLGNTPPTLAPVIDVAGVIYVGNARSLTALNKDGSTVWRLAGLFRSFTHPVVDSNSNVYIVASRISNVSGRYLIAVNHGAVVETKGLFPCVGALLLNNSGRLYCSEIGLFMYMGTAGNDAAAQWSQISHDATRSSRR